VKWVQYLFDFWVQNRQPRRLLPVQVITNARLAATLPAVMHCSCTVSGSAYAGSVGKA
jgi:hypothetical protein